VRDLPSTRSRFDDCVPRADDPLIDLVKTGVLDDTNGKGGSFVDRGFALSPLQSEVNLDTPVSGFLVRKERWP
jgi:hypothetical protein